MLSIYLKPTNYCNIGCEHCYLPEETRANKSTMNDETLSATARLAVGLALREGHDSVHFIWHGGEPLVLPPAYYWEAQKTLKNAMGNFPFTQSLQTSLIPYRNEWSELITQVFDDHIGSSVDFSQRHIKSSPEAYLDLWMKKVHLARDNGHFVLPGMVPSRHEISQSSPIYDWFVDHGFLAFNVERYSQFGGKTIDWPHNHEHAIFLTGLFDRVVADLKSKARAPSINVVSAAINAIMTGQPGERWGTQCQKEFIVVEPDGSLNTCPDRARHEPAYSNAAQGSEAFITSDQRRKWIRVSDITHKQPHCHTCEFRSFCKSGCPVTPNGPANGQRECSGYKSYLLHVQRYIDENPDQHDILRQYTMMKASGFNEVD